MDLETSAFERALHLALFLSGGIASGLVALAFLERISDDGRRMIRPLYVVAAVVVFALLFVAERVYHL